MDDIFSDVIQIFVEAFDRYLLAFTRLYTGLTDELAREAIQGLDVVIVLATLCFILFFLRSEIASLFGRAGKSGQKRRRRERILHYAAEDDEETTEDKTTEDKT